MGTHQFEFDAVYLLTCCCTCHWYLQGTCHCGIRDTFCLQFCSDRPLGFQSPFCLPFTLSVLPCLTGLSCLTLTDFLKVCAPGAGCRKVSWLQRSSLKAPLPVQPPRVKNRGNINPPRIAFFLKPNLLFLSWWLGMGLALTWEFTREFSRERKLCVISVILKQ